MRHLITIVFAFLSLSPSVGFAQSFDDQPDPRVSQAIDLLEDGLREFRSGRQSLRDALDEHAEMGQSIADVDGGLDEALDRINRADDSAARVTKIAQQVEQRAVSARARNQDIKQSTTPVAVIGGAVVAGIVALAAPFIASRVGNALGAARTEASILRDQFFGNTGSPGERDGPKGGNKYSSRKVA